MQNTFDWETQRCRALPGARHRKCIIRLALSRVDPLLIAGTV